MHRLTALLALLLLGRALGAGEPAPAVLNLRLEAHWLADGTRCWYRQQTAPRQHAFILVDAALRTRAPAFDHALMARALAQVLASAPTPEALPISGLELADDDRTIRIRAGGRWWEGPRATLALQASTRTSPPPPVLAPRPTRETGAPAALEVVNRSAGEIVVWWSAFDGARREYARLSPGGETRQDTYAGHVWIVTGAQGALLGVWEAEEGGSRIEIDGVPAPAAPEQPDGARERSPDGRWRVELREHNLWLRPADGVERLALTSDGTREDRYVLPVAWSPDSTHLVARRIRAGEGRTITLVESAPADRVQPRSRSVRYDKPGDRIDEPSLHLLRVVDRTRIALDASLLERPWSLGEPAWNGDGTAFTVEYNQRGHQLLRVVDFDRAGHGRALIEERSPTFIDYAGKYFLQPLPARRELLWLSERDGWNHLYRYDAVAGTVRNQVTRGAWAVRSIERVDEEAGQVWFWAGGLDPHEDPYHLHLARVGLDGGGLVRLTAGDGTHQVRWSPDRRWFVDSWSRVDAPPRHVLRDGGTGAEVVELAQADAGALLASGWQAPERVVATARDGTTAIHGLLWRPRGFDPGRRYPVVECIYAGPQSAHVPKAFHTGYGQQAIADLGFVVGMVDCLGTSWRSKAFHDVCWHNLADAGFPDRIGWWRAAAGSRSWLDLTRVGIYGGSAGGQNALGALLFHPEFYHVAVADCGCHDNRMDKIWWNELWMGWPVGPHYAAQSNVTHAAKLQGRLMLIVGELDDNVDPASTFQVAHALEQAGKDFELVVVHGAGHGAAETPFGTKKRAGFLVRHLLGREP